MKKKFRFLSLILTLVMCAALCVPAFAAAREAYQPHASGKLPVSGAGYDYWIQSTLYTSVFGSSRYASVWVQEEYGKTIPANYIAITPALCNSSGETIISGSKMYSSGNGTFLFANTKTSGDPDLCGATGFVTVQGYGVVTAPEVYYGCSRQVAYDLTESLTENGKYPVNAYGETYGSAMLASKVGHAPDLVSAVGSNGVSGYIRFVDMIADNAAGASLPLYDLEGNVIGAFVV